MITRTLEPQLVPGGAYWREAHPTERKLDFQAMEEAEGSAIHGSRLRMGLLLRAQRDATLQWIQGSRFTPGGVRALPRFMSGQIGNEIARVQARGYQDGLKQFSESSRRAAESAGRSGGSLSTAGLGSAAARRLIENAWKSGNLLSDRIQLPVRQLLHNAFGADGQRLLPLEAIEGQIRTAYGRWVEDAPSSVTPAEVRLATPLDEETTWSTWETRNLPIAAWLRQTADQLAIDGEPIPQLSETATKAILVTERNRQRNAAVYESGLKTEAVAAYRYSAIRDPRTCEFCLARDGITLPKRSPWWYWNIPPMHACCRCDLVQVMLFEDADLTPSDDAWAIGTQKVPAGFGGFDPNLAAGFGKRELLWLAAELEEVELWTSMLRN